jgi:hypothetical protein
MSAPIENLLDQKVNFSRASGAFRDPGATSDFWQPISKHPLAPFFKSIAVTKAPEVGPGAHGAHGAIGAIGAIGAPVAPGVVSDEPALKSNAATGTGATGNVAIGVPVDPKVRTAADPVLGVPVSITHKSYSNASSGPNASSASSELKPGARSLHASNSNSITNAFTGDVKSVLESVLLADDTGSFLDSMTSPESVRTVMALLLMAFLENGRNAESPVDKENPLESLGFEAHIRDNVMPYLARRLEGSSMKVPAWLNSSMTAPSANTKKPYAHPNAPPESNTTPSAPPESNTTPSAPPVEGGSDATARKRSTKAISKAKQRTKKK